MKTLSDCGWRYSETREWNYKEGDVKQTMDKIKKEIEEDVIFDNSWERRLCITIINKYLGEKLK